MTFKEIGRELGIKEQTAFRIYKRALKKLSHPRNKEKWRGIFETLGAMESERAERACDSNIADLIKACNLGDTPKIKTKEQEWL